jgi:DNA-binding protein HU-beta
MTKDDLVGKVASKAGLTKKQAAAAVNAFVDTVKEALAGDEKVTIVGFGTFGIKVRAARVGRNPRTGEKINIAEKKVPYFAPGRDLRSAVK